MNPAALIVGGAALGLAALLKKKKRATPPPTPDDGTTSVNVKTAQTMLVRLGAKLAIDGKFGPNTSKAWAAAASARKLSPTAIGTTGATTARVSAATAKALAAAAAKAPPLPSPKPEKAKTKPTPAPDNKADEQAALNAAVAARDRELAAAEADKKAKAKAEADKKAAAAKAARVIVVTGEAQTILRVLGATIAPDGVYGSATHNAWVAAARKRGLSTSITPDKTTKKKVWVTKATFDKLKAEAGKIHKSEPSQAEQMDSRIAPITYMPAENVLVPMLTLKAQQVLRVLGSAITADGKYGPNTATAWAQQAKARGINGTMQKGKSLAEVHVYQKTRDRLIADADAKAAAAQPAAKAAPASAETIVIPTLRAQQISTRHGASLKHDGLYGPNTMGAWQRLATTHHVSSRFEKASADGKQVRVDAQTLRKLDALPPSGAATAPVGYDRARAKARAKEVAALLRKQGRAHDKQMLADWQKQAGIAADGVYGPLTRNALVYYGATDAPAAFVQGTNRAYTPPA